MLKFNRHYFILTVLFLIVEVLIAVFVQDEFIRPYFGDVLVVILLYCFLRSFIKISVLKAIVLVVAFSFLIEFLQYLELIKSLKLERSSLAKVVLGTSFSREDLLMYLLGGFTIYIVERTRKPSTLLRLKL